MKDITVNRRKISPLSKAHLAVLSMRENGPLYFAYLGLSYLGTAVADFGFRKSDTLRRAKDLPGMNSRAANKLIWDKWDWSDQGDEWTPNPGWKGSVIRTFITPYFTGVETAVEVGPGAGRWTEHLIPIVGHLTAIDISEVCVQNCRSRFASAKNATFEVGNGYDLESVASNSVDAIWSFNVFVHINRPEFGSYVNEFDRILRPGGVGVIHHGAVGGSSGGWRSNVTLDDVQRFLKENGLELVSQVQSWVDGSEEYQAGLYNDAITVFRKRK